MREIRFIGGFLLQCFYIIIKRLCNYNCLQWKQNVSPTTKVRNNSFPKCAVKFISNVFNNLFIVSNISRFVIIKLVNLLIKYVIIRYYKISIIKIMKKFTYLHITQHGSSTWRTQDQPACKFSTAIRNVLRWLVISTAHPSDCGQNATAEFCLTRASEPLEEGG